MQLTLARAAVAALSGALWGLCFGPEPLVVLPWLVLAPLILLLAAPRAGWLGWLHGVAFWLASIPWIAPTLSTYGRLPGWLSVVLLGGLTLYLGAFTGGFAVLGARLWRRGGARALLGLPALWVALEWLRGHLLSGFPWNLSGYAWAAAPGALPTTAWIGTHGLSFVLVLVNVALALAVSRRRPAVWAWSVGAALLLLAFGARWGAGSGADRAGADRRPVRILQPRILNQVDWDPLQAERDYRRLIETSLAACDVPGALLIWPESAAWPLDYGDPKLVRDLRALAARGCPVLINSVSREGERYFNSALLVDAGGIAGRYDKRHLVPYGEYAPLSGLLPWLGRLARMAGDFSAGSGVDLLPWGEERLGVAICFEVTFPSEVAALVRGGATLLVTITNDAWYGDTAAPWQHFRAARFRAAELRRPLLRAAITGVSASIAADGTIVEQLGVMEEGVIRAEVVGRSDLGPYARRPWLPPALCWVVAAFAIFLPVTGGGRESR